VARSVITKLEYSDAADAAFAIVSGELAFATHGRHLVMLCGPEEEITAARCHFRAALRPDGARIVVDSLALGNAASDDPEHNLHEDGAVTAAMLRATRLEEIVNLFRRFVQTEPRHGAETAEQARRRATWAGMVGPRMLNLREAVQQADTLAQRRPRPGGRPALDEEHYRAIALRCIDLYVSGNGRGAQKALAAEYLKAPRTVADWIRKARHLELLAPGKPGAVSYEPGPRLLSDQSHPYRNRDERSSTDG
jgi:hypothetical protein